MNSNEMQQRLAALVRDGESLLTLLEKEKWEQFEVKERHWHTSMQSLLVSNPTLAELFIDEISQLKEINRSMVDKVTQKKESMKVSMASIKKNRKAILRYHTNDNPSDSYFT